MATGHSPLRPCGTTESRPPARPILHQVATQTPGNCTSDHGMALSRSHVPPITGKAATQSKSRSTAKSLGWKIGQCHTLTPLSFRRPRLLQILVPLGCNGIGAVTASAAPPPVSLLTEGIPALQTWVRSPRLRSQSKAEALVKSRSRSRSFEFLKARS